MREISGASPAGMEMRESFCLILLILALFQGVPFFSLIFSMEGKRVDEMVNGERFQDWLTSL